MKDRIATGDAAGKVRATSLAGLAGTLLITLGYAHLGALPDEVGIVLLVAGLWLVWLPTTVACFVVTPTRSWLTPVRIASGLSLGATAAGFSLLLR